MYKRTFTYKDYDGNERTEDHYFNLTEAEIIKWLTTTGDYTLDKKLERLNQEGNGKETMKIFEELIVMSYGIKSLDGRRFDKSEEAKKNFIETEAYNQLFVELATDARKAAEFVNAIIPREMADSIAKALKDNPEGIPDSLKDYLPEGITQIGKK